VITLTREEAQQVLDAIALSMPMFAGHNKQHAAAIETLRAQLAQPEPKPVAWMSSSRHIYHSKEGAKLDGVDKVAPVYVHPPKEWRGLTDDERTYLAWESKNGPHCVEMTEAKLKEKNASHL